MALKSLFSNNPLSPAKLFQDSKLHFIFFHNKMSCILYLKIIKWQAMNLEKLQKYSESAKLDGKNYNLRRKPVKTVEEAKGKEFVGLIGPRGAGKTVSLKQLASSIKNSFYLSVDTLERDQNLFELIEEIKESYKPEVFLLDEIHYNRNINKTLKNAYDLLGVKIIFTSSVALGMLSTAADLSRRVRLIDVPYFSFLEFIAFETAVLLPPLKSDVLINRNISPDYLRHDHLFNSYLNEKICPFSSDVSNLKDALLNILKRIINDDIPRLAPVTQDDIYDIEKVMQFIGRSSVEDINPTSVAKNCALPRTKAQKFINLLEQSFLLQQVWPIKSANILKEAKILIHPPFRTLYSEEDKLKGGLREDFASWALNSSGFIFSYLKNKRGQKCPDFLLKLPVKSDSSNSIKKDEKNIVLEIGGAGKSNSQFKGLGNDFEKVILKSSPPYKNGELPLWVLSCLESSTT